MARLIPILGRAISSSLQLVPARYFLFKRWLAEPEPTQKPVEISLDKFYRNNPSNLHQNEWLSQHLNDESLILDVALANSGLVIKPDDLHNAKAQIRHLVVQSNDDVAPVFNRQLISATLTTRARVSFEHCDIRTLLIEKDARSLYLSNTWVDHLVFREGLASLTISGGGILRISCSSDEALSGDAKVSTFFPRFEPPNSNDLQPFRNLRKNLNALHNNRAAGFFHAIELSLSRKSETKFNKFLSWFYEVLSDFGNSTSRPLFWLATSLLFMFSIALADNNLVATTEVNIASWQEVLVRSELEGRLSRAALYPLSSVNPLGYFSSRALVQAGQTFWMFAYIPLTLLGIASAALLILSVRRRFRLE